VPHVKAVAAFLAETIIGGAVGWWLTGVITDRIEVKMTVAVALGYFCTTYFVQMLIRAPFYAALKPLPRDIPHEGYPFNSELVAARFLVGSLPPESDLLAEGLTRARECVRHEAAELTHAGHGETARQILAIRTAISGDERTQAACHTVLEAARSGVTDGEAAREH
jgi:hypothetical protein